MVILPCNPPVHWFRTISVHRYLVGAVDLRIWVRGKAGTYRLEGDSPKGNRSHRRKGGLEDSQVQRAVKSLILQTLRGKEKAEK